MPRRVPCPTTLMLAALTSCAGTIAPRAFGEALVVVDTDLSPSLANRLRVDFYSDGVWFESRDVSRSSNQEWPASFSVYSDDDAREKLVWVRLRAHSSEHRRDYRGERFRDFGAEAPPIDSLGRPRLVVEGVDVTPETEPEPLVSVERLLLLRLRPGVRGAVRVTLRGACAGTMVKLAASQRVPAFGEAETCVDAEHTRVPVIESDLDSDRTPLPPSVAQAELARAGRHARHAARAHAKAAPNLSVAQPKGQLLPKYFSNVSHGAWHMGGVARCRSVAISPPRREERCFEEQPDAAPLPR